MILIMRLLICLVVAMIVYWGWVQIANYIFNKVDERKDPFLNLSVWIILYLGGVVLIIYAVWQYLYLKLI